MTGVHPRPEMPDRALALRRYRDLAGGYDAATRGIEGKRRRAIELLRLQPGQVVLDAACGTGSALAMLARLVGPEGRVIGVEQSPEMIAIARQRCTALGLQNVSLLEASVESAPIPRPVDAVLFSFAHDILQSPAALSNVFAAARPGARVASAGAKLYPRWLSFLDFWVRWRVRDYVSTLEGLEQPWRRLVQYVPDFAVSETTYFGSGYLGSGTYPGDMAQRASIAAPPCAGTAR